MIKDPERWLELVKAKEKDLLDSCIQAAEIAISAESEGTSDTEIGVYLTLQSGDINIVYQVKDTTLSSVRNGDDLCIFRCPAWDPQDEYDIAKHILSTNTGCETFEEFKQNKIVYMAERVVEDTITMLQREIQEQKEYREMQEHLNAHAQAHQTQYYEELKKEVTTGSEKDLQDLRKEYEKNNEDVSGPFL
jgi:dihydroneopterin aldolase